MGEVMKSYCYLNFDENEDSIAICTNSTIEFVEDIEKSSEIIKFKIEEGGFMDYQANDNGWPMFSQKLKDTICNDKKCNGNLNITKWNKVEVLNNINELKNYYVPVFNPNVDVLNFNKSILVDDFIVKPVLSYSKVNKYDAFLIPNSHTRVVFSSELQTVILKKKLKGIVFSKIATL